MENVKSENKPNLLKNKDYILLFIGGLVSRIGNGIHNIALVWYVLDVSGSATTTGTILLISTLPGVIFGPFSGVIADRINRKFLIVGMDIIRGLVAIWLGWMVYTGAASFFHLGLATVLMAICGSLFNPAVTATIPNIVADCNLQKANSAEHFSVNITQIIGAAIGGVLIAVVGVSGVFILNGISFLLSAFSELFIAVPPLVRKAAEAKVTFIHDLKVGASYLLQRKDLIALFAVAIILNFLSTGLFVIGFPYVFKEMLAVSSKLFG
ncbi:MAG: MFS transporter, partial [Halanaerobium sp.]|nr:MFS transporter [Halanaerobium sp.]